MICFERCSKSFSCVETQIPLSKPCLLFWKRIVSKGGLGRGSEAISLFFLFLLHKHDYDLGGGREGERYSHWNKIDSLLG